MKKLISILVLVLILSMAFSVATQKFYVRTNELFGDGRMFVVQQNQQVHGVIIAWGWYVIYGTVQDCRILPLWSPVGDAQKIRCKMIVSPKDTFFKGWIDFRGHPRPFCGALKYENIPVVCFGDN